MLLTKNYLANKVVSLVGLRVPLDRVVRDGERNLSSGETRRIEIARSLINRAEVIIYDEAISTLDVQTAYSIEKTLLSLEEQTVIFVSHNFPNLKRYFKRFNDAPYQVVVEINHKEDVETHDFYSEPLINYYYIASPTSDIPLPKIKRVNEEESTSHDEIFNIIRESYEMQGRTANRLSTASTGFTITTTSRHSGSNSPLAEYVYDSIKESLSEILGPLR